jgi:CrcB protein
MDNPCVVQAEFETISKRSCPVDRSVGLQKYFFIALGGALGSAARFWVGSVVTNRTGTRFPFGTLVVNITACLIIGLSLEVLNRHANLSPSWRFLVPIGFIGAYSTFSTFEWETFSSITQGAFWIAILYVATSLVFGLIAVALGVALAKAIA